MQGDFCYCKKCTNKKTTDIISKILIKFQKCELIRVNEYSLSSYDTLSTALGTVGEKEMIKAVSAFGGL